MVPKKKILYLPGFYVREHHLGIARYAQEAGWRLDAQMAHSGRVPHDWEGDGIITMSGDRADILEKIKKADLPTIEMFNGTALPTAPHVFIDNRAIGQMAGQHLIRRGFQDIGYFYHDFELSNQTNEAERSEGFRQAVEAAGRNFHKVTFDSGIFQISQLPRPLALMTQNDLMGDWLMHRLLEADLQVPNDVAIIGVNADRIYSEFSPVPQTVVESNIEYQGYAAAELLDRLMKGESVPSTPLMIQPERVVERASTSLLISQHPKLNKALAFVNEHFGNRIEVEDICRHVKLSRRQLDTLFKQFTGESASRHLLHIRINCARRLLVESDTKIQSLAHELGFSSAAYFSTVFHQETGLSPADFRQRSHIRR